MSDQRELSVAKWSSLRAVCQAKDLVGQKGWSAKKETGGPVWTGAKVMFSGQIMLSRIQEVRGRKKIRRQIVGPKMTMILCNAELSGDRPENQKEQNS